MSPLSELVSSILIWIAASTGQPVDIDAQVHIQYRSYTDLAVMYYQPNSLEELAGKQPVAALHINGTIFLPDDFDPTDPEDVSTLVHEVYHHVQHNNGVMHSGLCKGKIETEASRVENDWRAEHGLELIPEADILLVEMLRCPPARHANRIAWIKERRGRHAVVDDQ